MGGRFSHSAVTGWGSVIQVTALELGRIAASAHDAIGCSCRTDMAMKAAFPPRLDTTRMRRGGPCSFVGKGTRGGADVEDVLSEQVRVSSEPGRTRLCPSAVFRQ